MTRVIRPVRLVRARLFDGFGPIHRACRLDKRHTLCGIRIRHEWSDVDGGASEEFCARCAPRVIKVDQARRAA